MIMDRNACSICGTLPGNSDVYRVICTALILEVFRPLRHSHSRGLNTGFSEDYTPEIGTSSVYERRDVSSAPRELFLGNKLLS
jgi:hypothetical protein